MKKSCVVRPFSRVVILCGLMWLTWLTVSSSTAAPQKQALRSAFENYVTATVRPTARERQTLMSGGPITKLLESDASKEVAVFGAVWINGSRADYVRKVKDIENFERGGAFRMTKRISDPRGWTISLNSNCPRTTSRTSGRARSETARSNWAPGRCKH